MEFEQEFTAFVVDHQRRWRGVAFLVCGDWHRAEDAVQTALTRVYLRWSRIQDPASYARRAVVNAVIDQGRSRWRRREVIGHPPPEAVSETEDLDEETLSALAALPTRQRAVIVLRYIEDLDTEATAELLGISPGTVRSQAARGLAAMRAQMAGATTTRRGPSFGTTP